MTTTLPSPGTLDGCLTPADWGTTSTTTPTLASLSWSDDLFAMIESARDYADELLDLGTLPADWTAAAFQAASDHLLYTNSIYTYAGAFWQIVNFIEIAEARRWYADNADTPTSLADPDWSTVGGIVQAGTHMALMNIYLAVIRHMATNR